jgi:hypothetical protein
MKSDCQHEWIKGRPPAFTETCLWCGIPKVRTSAPRPVTKCPPRDTSPSWANRKYSSKDYSK